MYAIRSYYGRPEYDSAASQFTSTVERTWSAKKGSNDESDFYTIVDITANDRLGLP